MWPDALFADGNTQPRGRDLGPAASTRRRSKMAAN